MIELVRLFSKVSGFCLGICIRLALIGWRFGLRAVQRDALRIFGALASPITLLSRPKMWGERAVIWSLGYFLLLLLLVVLFGGGSRIIFILWIGAYVARLAFMWRGCLKHPVWSSSFGRRALWITEPSTKLGLFVIEPLAAYVMGRALSLVLPADFGDFFSAVYSWAFLGLVGNTVLEYWMHKSEAIDAKDALHQAERLDGNMARDGSEVTKIMTPQKSQIRVRVQSRPPSPGIDPALEQIREVSRQRMQKEPR